MQHKSVWAYVKLGTGLRYLQDVMQNMPIFDEGCILENIKSFLSELEKPEFQVTKRASRELHTFKEKIIQKEKSARISSEESAELRKIMNDIRLTFSAEAQGVHAFYTTEKRYEMSKLLGNVHLLFKEGCFEKISDTSRYDFIESGYCIAFERPTAAAFHILRGIEDVLKMYHKKFFKKDNSKYMWAQMITELKNKKTGKKPELVLLNHLDNIRISFRNPTQHPEKIYDISEVQDLLGLAIDVVNRMTTVL